MIEKFKNFLIRQVTQIQQGGIRVLYKKGIRRVKLVPQLFFILASVPCVLLIRLLYPIKKVRFIQIDAGRIGHFEVANVYSARRKSGEFSSDIIDIVYFTVSTGIVANVQYLKMWKRTLHSVPLFLSPYFKAIDKVNQIVPGKKATYSDGDRLYFTSDHNKAINNGITENILRHENSPISFSSEEHILGKKRLSELGIPENKQFICFHSRDSAFLDNLMPDREWSYHDFRDSNIQNYLPAAEEMAKRDYCAVRMGSHVKERLCVDNPKIIDYASSESRSDFLDIYLSAHCRFFIISDTGLSNPPEVFRKPMVYVNDFLFALLYRLSVKNCIFILKKYYLIQEERFLTFAEIAKTDLLYCGLGSELKKRDIEVVENTPEEILAATLEMEERLSGTWVPEEEDAELQKRFWSLLPSGLSKSPNCRIGAQFLRQNRIICAPINSALRLKP